MLLRALVSLSLLGLTMALAEAMRSVPSVVAGITLVALGAFIAPTVAAGVSPLALGLGAAGALGWFVLRPVAPLLAGAVLAAFVHGARSARAPDLPRVITAVSLSMAGGAAGTYVLSLYASLGQDDPLVVGAAYVVAALLFALPLVIGVEDPTTHALLSLASRSRGAARVRLLRVAALRRRADALPFALSRPDAARLQRAFHRVRALAEARADSPIGAQRGLDTALDAHVAAISRALVALRARWANETGLARVDAEELQRAADQAAAEAEALDLVAAQAMPMPLG